MSAEEKPDAPVSAASAAGEKPVEPTKPAEDLEKAAGQGDPRSRSWMLEMPVFFLILVVLQRALLPDDPGFRGVNPNPFWLGVIIFGTRYGIAAGLGSGFGASLLYALGTWQSGESYRFADLDFYFQPGLFAVVGAAIGFAADRFMHRIASLRMRIEDLEELVRGLRTQITSEQKVLRAVEQQVVSQMSSIVTLFQGSKELGTLDRHELFPAMLDFFADALRARKSSLYVPQDGGWELHGQKGWKDGDPFPRSIPPGKGLVGLAASEKRVVSLRDLFSSGKNEKDSLEKHEGAIMAVPILNPQNDPVAVFAVQAMDFLRFNSASLNLAALLAEWGAESVAKCVEVEGLRSRSILDEEFGVHSIQYFEERTTQEFSRSLRFALPFSLLLIAPGGEAPGGDGKRTAYLRVISRVVLETVRKIDVVSKTPFEEAPFAVLLMTTTQENAGRVRERIKDSLKRVGLEESIRLGVGSYKADMKNKEEIFAQAREDIG